MSTRRDCTCPKSRHEHGTAAAYLKDRCRCFPCRLAKANYGNGGEWDTTMVSAVGTMRRLRALAVIGWAPAELAPLLNQEATYSVSAWRKGNRYDRVSLRTHNRVAAIYDQLWDKPSTGRYRNRVVRNAQRQGWLPPLAWDDDTIDTPDDFLHIRHDDKKPVNSARDGLHTFVYNHDTPNHPGFIDEIAVERAMHGDTKCATKAEMSEAIRILTGMNYTADMIADRLGVSTRHVQRYRAKGRAA